MSNTLAINAVGDELEQAAEFCRVEGIGLEVTDFAYPEKLETGLAENIARHQQLTAGISPLSVHGPFFDLVATSLDPAIVELTRRRHAAALKAASEIGAALYIAHTNFNPLIRDTSYLNSFTRRSLDFWLPFADYAAEHQIVICLENLWEPGPEIQADLVATANHPGLRATLDNGHVLVFSEHPAGYWLETLGTDVAHCHLHDNSGALDEHKAVAEGIEQWHELMAAVAKWSPSAVLVTESDKLELNRLSVQRLRDLQNAHETPRG